jgi:hypothetical protein
LGEFRVAIPLNIQLELTEFAVLDEVLQQRNTGLLGRGKVLSNDLTRPSKLLEIERQLFLPLGNAVTFKLGDGTGSDRFLKAGFSWNGDPDVGGVSAHGLSRTKLGPFNRKTEDQNKPVTGYIFEGAIGGWIADILGAVPVHANNIFATFIAHELGHQLGLAHEPQPDNIMFIWSDQPLDQRKQYLRLSNDVKLPFTKAQVTTMLGVLAKT